MRIYPLCLGLSCLALLSCDKTRTNSVAPTDSAAVVQGSEAKAKASDAVAVNRYPAARRGDTQDTYHGVTVADPYRWLEKIDSGETKTWIDAQVQTTRAHLDQIPQRSEIASMLEKAWNFERYGLPYKSGKRYFISHNSGLQNQSVLYWADSLKGELKPLLDPNSLSSDGTVALSGISISDDGRYLAYGLSESGSDWQTWQVRDVATGKDMSDKVEWIKFSGATWSPDNKGFYYSRYDEPKKGEKLSVVNKDQKVYYHKLGTPQAQDRLVYQRPDNPEWGLFPSITEDGRYLFLYVTKGTDSRNRLFYQDLREPESKRKTVELIADLEASYSVIGNRGSKIIVRTNESAPRGRVIEIDLRKPQKSNWKELIPQVEEKLDSASFVGDRIFANYLKDAHSVVRIFDRNGRSKGDVQLPGIGSAGGFQGKAKSKETFFSYTSFASPSTIYRYDIAKNKTSVYKAPKLTFNPDDFITEQVFFPSKDGTKIPMSLTYKKGLVKNAANPTYLYGYGGFNISLRPAFSPKNLVWMQMGGIYAQANLRGGGEYGEAWHQAGMKTNKQNVFDDFISAAEWLINAGYTRKEKLAIGGASNGGLLVAATMVQRPDLFAAALPGVGVLDMLRFPEFTIGRAWTSDYGSPTNPEEFKALLAYSPYHNTKQGVSYPATMVYTADHDDRVYPAHSFKFAAALQHAQGGEAPTLIRIETKAGHGAGMPTSKKIGQWADLWAFLAKHLEIEMPASKAPSAQGQAPSQAQ